MSRAVIALAALVACSACTTGQPKLKRGTLTHQEREREFFVYAAGEGDARPLVIALHGGGGKARGFNRSTNGQLKREAKARGWVLVFPQGIAKGWNDGRELKAKRDNVRAGVDDVGFIAKLIARMKAEHGIDETRVFATGISNGGFMSTHLALEMSEKIAGIGVVTAQMATVHEDRRPSRPVAALFMNGTKDPIVPYEGGKILLMGQDRGAILSTDETLRRWLAFNGCSGASEERALLDASPKDKTRVFVKEGVGCQAPVARYRVVGGGHTWPGGKQYLGERVIGKVSRDIDGAKVIFDFFAAVPATAPR